MKAVGCIFLLSLFYLSSWSQPSEEKFKFNTLVTTQDHKAKKGKLKAAEEDRILLLQKNKLDQPLVIPAQNIQSLQLYRKEKNKKKRMVGMLVGTGVGALMGTLLATSPSSNNVSYGTFAFSGSPQSDGAIVGGVLGFIAGRIIGAQSRTTQNYLINGDIEKYRTYLPDIQKQAVNFMPH